VALESRLALQKEYDGVYDYRFERARRVPRFDLQQRAQDDSKSRMADKLDDPIFMGLFHYSGFILRFDVEEEQLEWNRAYESTEDLFTE